MGLVKDENRGRLPFASQPYINVEVNQKQEKRGKRGPVSSAVVRQKRFNNGRKDTKNQNRRRSV